MSPLHLHENQQRAYQALSTRLDYGGGPGTICLVGDFQSGKTRLVNRLLDERFDTPADYYVSLTLYLLNELEKQSASMRYAGAKAKTRLLMQITIEDLLQSHFQTRDLIVLDAIEGIYPYELNLVSLTHRFARDGKRCLICIPESPQHNYHFDFSWGLAEVIRIQ